MGIVQGTLPYTVLRCTALKTDELYNEIAFV